MDTGYPNSNGFQSISVCEGEGSTQSGPLAEVALHNHSTRQAIKVVRIPLHHCRALCQVLGLVVHASHTRLLVRKLGFDMILVEPVFVEHRRRDMSEAVTGLPAF